MVGNGCGAKKDPFFARLGSGSESRCCEFVEFCVNLGM